MAVDPSLVEKIQADTTFRADVIEQILSLKDLLKKIGEDPDLSSHFVLIGGTAINLFSNSIPRLSVDIDLDYTNKNNVFKPALIDKHLNILSRLGSSIKMKAYDSRKANEKSAEKLRMIFEYNSNFLPSEGTVKLDISYLMKETVYEPKKLKMQQIHSSDGFSNLSFSVADPHELWAGKAIALVYKTSEDPKPNEVSDLYSMQIARHLFDVSRLMETWKDKTNILQNTKLRKAFILKGVPRVNDLYFLGGDKLRKCTSKQIETELDPYLHQPNNKKGNPERPSLDKMKRSAKEFLHIVCSNVWTEKEKQFTEEFQERGNYKPGLLFDRKSKEYKRLVNNKYLISKAQERRLKTKK
jgi:predicted nucleotidyltransferase component of viral defense system